VAQDLSRRDPCPTESSSPSLGWEIWMAMAMLLQTRVWATDGTVFGTLLSMAQRIALTRIELGNTVGHTGGWCGRKPIFQVIPRRNSVSPHHPRTCE
jgi:hypothetical protein